MTRGSYIHIPHILCSIRTRTLTLTHTHTHTNRHKGTKEMKAIEREKERCGRVVHRKIPTHAPHQSPIIFIYLFLFFSPVCVRVSLFYRRTSNECALSLLLPKLEKTVPNTSTARKMCVSVVLMPHWEQALNRGIQRRKKHGNRRMINKMNTHAHTHTQLFSTPNMITLPPTLIHTYSLKFSNWMRFNLSTCTFGAFTTQTKQSGFYFR